MPPTKDTMALWLWEWMMVKTNFDLAKTMTAAPKVVALALPIIVGAVMNPYSWTTAN